MKKNAHSVFTSGMNDTAKSMEKPTLALYCSLLYHDKTADATQIKALTA